MGPNGNRYKVVVVDDEAMAVKAICLVIEKHFPQFKIVGTAENGSEALDVIKEMSPDLVLTDVEMPVMNGLGRISERRAGLPDETDGSVPHVSHNEKCGGKTQKDIL